MAIGAQGYSIGDAIRTVLGEVLDVMYFKKWPSKQPNGPVECFGTGIKARNWWCFNQRLLQLF